MSTADGPIVARDGGVDVRVLVVPGASRDEIVGRHGDVIRIRVASPPEGGRANAALRRLVARTCGLRRSDVDVVAGASSRRKTLHLRGAEPAAVSAALEPGRAPGTPEVR